MNPFPSKLSSQDDLWSRQSPAGWGYPIRPGPPSIPQFELPISSNRNPYLQVGTHGSFFQGTQLPSGANLTVGINNTEATFGMQAKPFGKELYADVSYSDVPFVKDYTGVKMGAHAGYRRSYDMNGVPVTQGISAGTFSNFSRNMSAGVRMDRDVGRTPVGMDAKPATTLTFWGLFKFW